MSADARGIMRGEALGQLQQEWFGASEEARHFGETGARERDQPLNFDRHAIAHESGFREPVAQGFGFRRIAAVERGERIAARTECRGRVSDMMAAGLRR